MGLWIAYPEAQCILICTMFIDVPHYNHCVSGYCCPRDIFYTFYWLKYYTLTALKDCDNQRSIFILIYDLVLMLFKHSNENVLANKASSSGLPFRVNALHLFFPLKLGKGIQVCWWYTAVISRNNWCQLVKERALLSKYMQTLCK